MIDKKTIILKAIKEIIPQYTTKITLRQLYYRLVTKFTGTEILPNKQSSYQYISKILVKARLDGIVPFNIMEDRTRGIEAGDSELQTPEGYFNQYLRYLIDCGDDFRFPRWHKQDYYVEVWIEKEALSGIFGVICKELGVILNAVKGYPSLTMLKNAADRFNQKYRGGKECIMLYFGDMDPSGQDIPRHIIDTLTQKFGCNIEQVKKAITKEQIEEYEILPMPAKKSDSRYKSFIAKYGKDAVELDALDPDTLQEIIRESVGKYFDEDIYEEVDDTEGERGRKEIKNLLEKTLKKGVLDET